MLEKPKERRTPEEYRAESRRTFRLYHGLHWSQHRIATKTGKIVTASRYLNPEIQEWLDEMNFPHRVILLKDGRSKIVFQEDDHAILWKLTWT